MNDMIRDARSAKVPSQMSSVDAKWFLPIPYLIRGVASQWNDALMAHVKPSYQAPIMPAPTATHIATPRMTPNQICRTSFL